MASYMFLMQFGNATELSELDETRWKRISEIGGAVTLISCVINLTLLCFLTIRSDGLFITGNMCVVLMAAQLSFLGSENTSYPDPIMCKIATALLQYFFLCVQFSSLTYAFHLWSKFGPGFLATWRTRGMYLCITWLAPLFIVVITWLFRGHLYAKESRCWLPFEHSTRLAFLLPLAVVLTVNTCLYIVIIRYTAYLDFTKGLKKTKIIKHALKTTLSLIPVLGLQWTLGFSVTFGGSRSLQYLYVVLASTQGLQVLLFHSLTNSLVQKALCDRIAIQGTDLSSSQNDSMAQTVDSRIGGQSENIEAKKE